MGKPKSKTPSNRSTPKPSVHKTNKKTQSRIEEIEWILKYFHKPENIINWLSNGNFNKTKDPVLKKYIDWRVETEKIKQLDNFVHRNLKKESPENIITMITAMKQNMNLKFREYHNRIAYHVDKLEEMELEWKVIDMFLIELRDAYDANFAEDNIFDMATNYIETYPVLKN